MHLHISKPVRMFFLDSLKIQSSFKIQKIVWELKLF